MAKYKVGIIGCGWIGIGQSHIAKDAKKEDTHFNAYKNNPETQVVALCDSKKSFIPDWGINKYTDYMQMVTKRKLDIVSVCTPPETHKEIVCNIAPYVRGIYCEKPIASTLQDGWEMIQACRKNKVILQINHQRLFMMPTFRYSRGILDTGTHMFSLIRHLFREGVSVYIEAVDTDEHVFELDCTHNKDVMIPFGVAHLIKCLKENRQSVSSGEKAFEALRLALEYQERTGCK